MKIGSTDIVDCKIGTTQVNKVYLGSNLAWEKSSPLLLDLYPNAASAYSLRKLRTAYAGSAIRVRRSSDNAEQDINFVGNELDTASLLSFVGAGNGTISVWYDQSGEGFDVTQVAVTNQPFIVLAGSLVEENGKPSIYFNGTNELISQSNTNYGTSSRSLFLASKLNEAVSTRGIVSLTNLSDGAGRLWIITPEIAARANTYTWISSTPLPSDNLSILSNIYTSGLLLSGNSMWLNGNGIVRTAGANGVVNTSIGKLYIGNNGLGGGRINAFISEFVAYQSDQTGNRLSIESNINSHYTIY